MGVHFLAAVTQITRAIAASEPCAFDASHASIADCSCMDEGRKVCCIEDGRSEGNPTKQKDKKIK